MNACGREMKLRFRNCTASNGVNEWQRNELAEERVVSQDETAGGEWWRKERQLFFRPSVVMTLHFFVKRVFSVNNYSIY